MNQKQSKMHSFADPFGVEYGKAQERKVDFPVWIALACLLLDKLMHEDYKDPKKMYI